MLKSPFCTFKYCTTKQLLHFLIIKPRGARETQVWPDYLGEFKSNDEGPVITFYGVSFRVLGTCTSFSSFRCKQTSRLGYP